MKEAPVEKRLVSRLTALGFKVLKLTTPGTQFTPDRLILRPMWSPGPPWVVEVKRPGKTERRGQELTRDDWRARGVLVLDMVDTYEAVDALVNHVQHECELDRAITAAAYAAIGPQEPGLLPTRETVTMSVRSFNEDFMEPPRRCPFCQGKA